MKFFLLQQAQHSTTKRGTTSDRERDRKGKKIKLKITTYLFMHEKTTIAAERAPKKNLYDKHDNSIM